MRSLRLLCSGLIAGLVLFRWLSVAPAAPLDELIAATRKEGTLNFYGPSTLKPEGAQVLAQAFNKRYGTNIDVRFIPSGSMTRDVGNTAHTIAASRNVLPDIEPISAQARNRLEL